MAWFRDQAWSVYQEVRFRGTVADIVVTRGPLVGVVECKLALGLTVLEQAHRWLPDAHYVWAATAYVGSGGFASRVARQFGIGLLGVRATSDYRDGALVPCLTVDEVLTPVLRRRVQDTLKAHLRPEHADGTFAAAGSQLGERFSPFKATCRELLRLVTAEPGLLLKDAVDRIKHHYASPATARSSLTHWIEAGSVPGIELRRDGRRLRLYPKEAPSP